MYSSPMVCSSSFVRPTPPLLTSNSARPFWMSSQSERMPSISWVFFAPKMSFMASSQVPASFMADLLSDMILNRASAYSRSFV